MASAYGRTNQFNANMPVLASGIGRPFHTAPEASNKPPRLRSLRSLGASILHLNQKAESVLHASRGGLLNVNTMT
jgi:hypothetical protein